MNSWLTTLGNNLVNDAVQCFTVIGVVDIERRQPSYTQIILNGVDPFFVLDFQVTTCGPNVTIEKSKYWRIILFQKYIYKPKGPRGGCENRFARTASSIR